MVVSQRGVDAMLILLLQLLVLLRLLRRFQLQMRWLLLHTGNAAAEAGWQWYWRTAAYLGAAQAPSSRHALRSWESMLCSATPPCSNRAAKGAACCLALSVSLSPLSLILF